MLEFCLTMHNSVLAHSNASVHTHRTATRLNAFIEELLNPVTVEKNVLEEKQQFVKRKLENLLHDKAAFVECLDTGDKMQKRLLHRSSKSISAPPTSSHELTEEDKMKKAAEAEARYLQVKLDMAMFLELLRKNELCENIIALIIIACSFHCSRRAYMNCRRPVYSSLLNFCRFQPITRVSSCACGWVSVSIFVCTYLHTVVRACTQNTQFLQLARLGLRSMWFGLRGRPRMQTMEARIMCQLTKTN